jgi:hypothetical protein
MILLREIGPIDLGILGHALNGPALKLTMPRHGNLDPVGVSSGLYDFDPFRST